MSRKKKIKVAIRGIATGFHDVAAPTYFHEPIDIIVCLSFHTLCEKLKHREADFAVMAIETHKKNYNNAIEK
ncbi:MAG TPA: prephenate dehydratase domain-containing protein [Chitinophagales bacterium]|nr:prephenate dehydratase domain-containing protein [Chitinophagales bacterium]